MKTVNKTLLSATLIALLGIAQPSLAALHKPPFLHTAGHQTVVDGSGQPVSTQADESQQSPQATLKIEDDEYLVVNAINGAEFFGFNNADLTAQAKADLDQLVQIVKDADYLHGITVTGHADPIGKLGANEVLAQQRADAVKRYLVDQGGIPADWIITQSEGSTYPFVSCDQVSNTQQRIQCLAPDRRADVQAVIGNDFDVVSVSES